MQNRMSGVEGEQVEEEDIVSVKHFKRRRSLRFKFGSGLVPLSPKSNCLNTRYRLFCTICARARSFVVFDFAACSTIGARTCSSLAELPTTNGRMLRNQIKSSLVLLLVRCVPVTRCNAFDFAACNSTRISSTRFSPAHPPLPCEIKLHKRSFWYYFY